ncbi:MAG: leucyl/phenylalanyl-tRNA--protein transferase [Actinomycetota bacterium]
MTTFPIEPPPSQWLWDITPTPGEDLVAVGGDLAPGTLLSAYRRGLFPMGTGAAGAPPMGWWCPEWRGILPVSGIHVSRSLRRTRRRFSVTVNHAFDAVLAGCADPNRSGRWITTEVAVAYQTLHRMGWAHSIECWRGDQLAGGLYGIAVGGLFAGESMFHREADASKVAVVALAEIVQEAWRSDPPGTPARLVDVQWRTSHLASLGVVAIPREVYAARLAQSLSLSPPTIFSSGPQSFRHPGWVAERATSVE